MMQITGEVIPDTPGRRPRLADTSRLCHMGITPQHNRSSNLSLAQNYWSIYTSDLSGVNIRTSVVQSQHVLFVNKLVWQKSHP